MSDTVRSLRNAMLGLLLLGSTGSLIELILLDHYEDAWQYVPLIVLGLALAIALWHMARPSLMSIRAFQTTMVLFVVAGIAGVWLHLQGAAEFQREIDPTLGWWTVVNKALRSKAPPVLAPGLLSQLGLLGLAYAYRNPGMSRRQDSDSPRTER